MEVRGNVWYENSWGMRLYHMRMLHDPVVEKTNQAAKLPYSKDPSYILKTGDFPRRWSHCFCFLVCWQQVQKRVVLIGGKARLASCRGCHKGEQPSPNRLFNRHGWEVPPGEKQAASAYVNAKIIIKLISNVGKAGGSLQTNQFWDRADLPEFFRKGIASIRFGRSPLCFCCFLCWVVVIPRSWSSEQRSVCFLWSKN